MSSITKNQKCEKQGIPYRELRRNGYNIGFVFLLRKSTLAAKRGTDICKQCRASYFIISCVVPKNAARVITTVALTIMDYTVHTMFERVETENVPIFTTGINSTQHMI